MIIIAVGVAGMGALQHGFHKLTSEDWKVRSPFLPPLRFAGAFARAGGFCGPAFAGAFAGPGGGGRPRGSPSVRNTHRRSPHVCSPNSAARVQTKRAGLRNGSGMDMFDWQLAKRDEQMKEAVELASQKGVKGEPWAYWKAFHEAEAAHH